MATPSYFQIIQGNNQEALPGVVFTDPVVFRAYDTLNNPMPNEPVIWSLPLSGPSGLFLPAENTTPVTINTDISGYAFGPGIRAGSIVGTWQGAVQFSNALSILSPYTAINKQFVAVPTTLTITQGANAKAALNAAYSQLVVVVTDQTSAGMAGVTVRATVPAGHGTFVGGVLTINAVSGGTGVTVFPVFTANGVAGPFTATIDVPSTASLVPITTTWTNVDASVPTTVQVSSGNNQQAGVNSLFPLPLKVRVTNGLGSVLSGVVVTFTSPPAGASCSFPTLLSTTTGVSDAQGIAASPTPLANAFTGTYYVTATVSGATSAQFGLTNGLAYLPEVCSAQVIPVTAGNYGTGLYPWSNPTNALNINSAFVEVFNDGQASKILLCAPLTAAVLALIEDGAIITKFTAQYDVRSVRTGSYFPSLQTFIANGATLVSVGTLPGGPSTDTGFQAQSLVFTTFSNPPLTGAELKAGNIGVGFTTPSNAGEAGTVYIRFVTLSVCYTNPAGVGGTATATLNVCEA